MGIQRRRSSWSSGCGERDRENANERGRKRGKVTVRMTRRGTVAREGKEGARASAGRRGLSSCTFFSFRGLLAGNYYVLTLF